MGDEYDNDLDFEEVIEENEEMMKEDVGLLDFLLSALDYLPTVNNPEMSDEEIEKPENWREKKRKLEEKYEAEGRDFRGFYAENPDLITKAVKTGMKADLKSVGLTWDHLGDLSQDKGLVVAQDLNALEQKDKVREFIRDAGPETAQEIADRMFEEGRLKKEAYETISRLVRIHEFDSK